MHSKNDRITKWPTQSGHNGSNGAARSLLILGDSISLGVYELRGNEVAERVSPTYVDLIQRIFPDLQIQIEAGPFWNTSDFYKKIDEMISKHSAETVLVMVGGSDADMDWKRFVLSDGAVARSRVSVERYEKNLRHIVAQLLAAGRTPILSDIPNHHFEIRGPYISKIAGKDVMSLIERGGGQAESDRHLAMFRAVVAQIATEKGLELVRYGQALDQRDPKVVLSVDGAHPNAAGHQVIVDVLLPALQRVFGSVRNELRA
jgi:lysophospholipase L1-like esterase